MYLKSLELTGFKSFAKKSFLNFDSKITAIVGPNGSGKSNMAEAFSFVLGEQSIKSLRGKKGEDMIFNGSAKVNKLNRASVKVIFDNSKKIFNIDFPEISIERVVYRDGVNEYLISGSQVRLRDVVELLSQAHIGASGHHIISQGEADKILNANSRERREMLEDALSLKIYQYKKTESLKKLEKTKENMKSVESLRRELAPHLKFLKKQMEKVEKSRELRDSLRTLYKEYFKREETYIKTQKDFLEIEKKAPLAELSSLDNDLKEAKEVLSKSKLENKRSGELLDIEGKIKAVRLMKEGLSRELGMIDGEINALRKNIQRQEVAFARDENKMIYLRDVESLYQKTQHLFDKGETSTDINVFKEVFLEIKKLISEFIASNKSKIDTSEINQAKKEIEDLLLEKAELENKLREASETDLGLNREYLKIKDEIEKEKEGGLEAEKSILKIMSRQQEINSDLTRLKAIEEKLSVEDADLKRELYEAGILLGREALEYRDFSVLDKDNNVLSEDLIMREPRSDQYDRRKAIERIKIRLEEYGTGGEDVVKEYNEVGDRDKFLEKELIDLGKSAESLAVLIKELEEKLDIEFKEGVRKINEKFQEFFSHMFGGGKAFLSVVQEEKRRRRGQLEDLDNIQESEEEKELETETGISIEISLPHKRIKGLEMLSGGERALTSIALLFAMSQVNPPPFIILDETDAALDEANSKKYGDMIESLSRYSELILITHNRETMSRAGMIYGVTMGSDGVSKLLSIAFEEAVKVAK